MTEAFRAQGLHQAMYVVPVLSVALAVVLFAAARAAVRDRRALTVLDGAVAARPDRTRRPFH